MCYGQKILAKSLSTCNAHLCTHISRWLCGTRPAHRSMIYLYGKVIFQKSSNVHICAAILHTKPADRTYCIPISHIAKFFLQNSHLSGHLAHRTTIYSERYFPKVFQVAHFSSSQILICAAILHTGPALPPTQRRVSSHTHRMTGDGKLRLRNS